MAEADNARASEVSFFAVPLVCGAAPHLGCGTLAKPVLSQIEKEVSVREAWLNRQGTVLAIVWAVGSENHNAEPVLPILQNAGFMATELRGSDLRQALAAFRPDYEWYRATQIDSLSEEEAGVIASRLVRRLSQRVALTAHQTNQLMDALRSACARILTNAVGTSAAERLDQIAATLPRVARELLDDAGLAAFEEVVALGHRPLFGEA